MTKVILIYASMTGNTEEMAEAVSAGILAAGGTPTVKMAYDAEAEDLLGYDGIVLGAYTWGDGDLPDEFVEFYEDMDHLDLAGSKAAVFGSGDTGYAEYCVAVDILGDKLKARGAEIVLEGLKMELCPSAEEKLVCRQFGESLVRSIQGQGEEIDNGTAV